MKQRMTESERWRRDLDKIDRRLEGRFGHFSLEQKDLLWQLREQLFIAGEVPNLDRELREIKKLGD